MKSFHAFVSLKPPVSTDSGLVSSADWNDVHNIGAVPTQFTASGAVAGNIDFVRAVGGSGAGITLTLLGQTYQVTGPNGLTNLYQCYHAMKVDSGAGPVKFVDNEGLLLNGQLQYSLANQYQWAIFIWNGVGWEVMGN